MTSPGEDHRRHSEEDHLLESPSKRRKITPPQGIFLDADTLPTLQDSILEVTDGGQGFCPDNHENISISASSKQAGQTAAPFLARHIPEQYAPAGGGLNSSGKAKMKDPNTKYCYRHRPDLKCRRQANEPSMDQLQRVSRPMSPENKCYAYCPQGLEDLSQSDQQAIALVWSLFSAAPAKHRSLMLQGMLHNMYIRDIHLALTWGTQVYSHNVASHNCPICPLMSEILSASISSRPYHPRYPTKFSAFWTRHPCAKRPKSASDGDVSRMMMWYGIGCASSISIESARSAAGVYHCWRGRGSGPQRDRSNYVLLVED